MTAILSVNWEYIKISHFRSIEAYHSVFPFLYPAPNPERSVAIYQLQHSAVSSSWQISM